MGVDLEDEAEEVQDEQEQLGSLAEGGGVLSRQSRSSAYDVIREAGIPSAPIRVELGKYVYLVTLSDAADFVTKPFSPEALELKVRRVLEALEERGRRERAEAETSYLREVVGQKFNVDKPAEAVSNIGNHRAYAV